MLRFVKILFAVTALTVIAAEAPNSRSLRSQPSRRNHFFARQVAEIAATDAVTPYPSADELKPELPFEEVGNNFSQEEQIFGQADAVNGPPSAKQDPKLRQSEHIEPQIFETNFRTKIDVSDETVELAAGEEVTTSSRLIDRRRFINRRPAKLLGKPRVQLEELHVQIMFLCISDLRMSATSAYYLKCRHWETCLQINDECSMNDDTIQYDRDSKSYTDQS
ncbi:hypothetical protein GQX74_012718 [Glossina fuscipes]|nr:hypothetical protein GQX74_012718 [Glossina fuscipes]